MTKLTTLNDRMKTTPWKTWHIVLSEHFITMPGPMRSLGAQKPPWVLSLKLSCSVSLDQILK